ncbi:MAG: ribosome small subunit-dependent GTPase A [Gemmataceae bacterium]|nr:ribosome small subunit-dependent GTPase A [Gemmataceae bacterium]MDW8241941.1 ribosome small subunit-dependent GTPase A [Thermogemmata sp.]
MSESPNEPEAERRKKKVRVELRRNLAKRRREKDLTRDFQEGEQAEDVPTVERVRAKGELSRRRTVVTDTIPGDEPAALPAVDPQQCIRGRVLRVHGLLSVVAGEDGHTYRCAVRRLLKSLATDERNVVTCGDVVWVRPAPVHGGDPHAPREGFIERVEPRHGLLTRASRGREHVVAANVDQAAIVLSLMQPELKPHLIDRYLAAAALGQLQPLIILNKVDLVADPASYQPLIGYYAQLGIPVLLTSAVSGYGLPYLRQLLRQHITVFAGQSGVGKSSLLNALIPELHLPTREVSAATEKGRHTTTYAQLLPLPEGGWVVDTPGVRQLQLWNVQREEVEGLFIEFRPFVPLCAFADCTHTHETGCAIQQAVARNRISLRRYHSYLGLFHDLPEDKW